MFDFLKRWTQSEHERAAENLSAYVDGELTIRQTRQVEAHLTRCDACAEDLRMLRYTKSLLAQTPMPELPRSFVIRRADLEEAAPEPRTILGLRPRLAYTYLRGATALAAVAFALLVAGDQVARFSLGARQPDLAMAPKAVEIEREAVVETVLGEAEAVQSDATIEEAETVMPAVEKEVEKAVLPAPTESLPLPEKQEESVRALEANQESTDEVAAVEAPAATGSPAPEGGDELPTPTPMPETVTLRPTPSSPPAPTALPAVMEEPGSQEGPSLIRIAEISLGGLALLLLIVTLIVRRQQL